MPRNRSLPPHLEIRRAGYYWRRRLPRSLVDRGGAKTVPGGKFNFLATTAACLCLSLRLHLLRDAKILARRLTEMSDRVFAADAEMMMAIAPETQVQLLESLARFEIAAFERARAVAGPRSAEAAAMDLRREEALQTTLRQALYFGNREVAQRPLRHVAAQLGLALDEADEDWVSLAYEATKVLLDVSQERARRQQGLYDHPTVAFRRAVGTSDAAAEPRCTVAGEIPVAPAAFASGAPPPGPVPPARAAFTAETNAAVSTGPTAPAPAPASQATAGYGNRGCALRLRAVSFQLDVPDPGDRAGGVRSS